MDSKTNRTCCIPFCDNYVQLVNIQCECTKDKVFNKKHYMCMACYLQMLKVGAKTNTYCCPLDRSPLLEIDPFLKSIIETDNMMEGLFAQMSAAIDSVNEARRNVRPSPRVRPRQEYESPRSVRIRRVLQRQNAVLPSVFPEIHDLTWPSPVANVREAMIPENTPIEDRENTPPLSVTILDYGEADIPPAGQTPPRREETEYTELWDEIQREESMSPEY